MTGHLISSKTDKLLISMRRRVQESFAVYLIVCGAQQPWKSCGWWVHVCVCATDVILLPESFSHRLLLSTDLPFGQFIVFCGIFRR